MKFIFLRKCQPSQLIAFLVVGWIWMGTGTTFAQKLGITNIYRSVQAERAITACYDNDFFVGTDYGNSQNVYLGIQNPAFSFANPLSYFFHKEKFDQIHGLAIGLEGFTPINIGSPAIQFGDYPYAGTLFLQGYTIANTKNGKLRVASSTTVGVIGPLGGGFEIQDYIHRKNGSTRPKGWGNQIANDIVLNLGLKADYKLLQASSYLFVTGGGGLQLGTLTTAASLHTCIMAGWLDNPVAATTSKKFQIAAFVQPEINFIGYDATLQGGVFNIQSPYTIGEKTITRTLFSYAAGVRINYKSFQLLATRYYTSAPFGTTTAKANGGLQISFGL